MYLAVPNGAATLGDLNGCAGRYAVFSAPVATGLLAAGLAAGVEADRLLADLSAAGLLISDFLVTVMVASLSFLNFELTPYIYASSMPNLIIAANYQ
jgi:hypothetical protein